MKKYIHIAILLLLVGVSFFVIGINNADNPNTVTDTTTNTPVQSDDEVPSTRKKDKDDTSQSVSSDNLFYDLASQTTDVNIDKTLITSSNSDSDSDDGETEEISPLADAALLLRASNVPLDWTASDVWENEGTLGAVANAEVRDSINVPNSHVVTPEYLPLFANGPGFKVDKPDYSPQYHGFEIPDNDALDIPNAGALTLIFDVSLIDPDDPTNKLAQKYPNIDLGSSEEGWILENINLGEYEGSISLVNATKDENGFVGIFTERRTTTDRFTVAIRWDRDTDTLRMFINGVEDYVQANPTLTTLGDINTEADLVLCGGNVFHNVAIFDRALSDSEIADIDQIFRQN